MDINELIAIVKKKLKTNINIDRVEIKDKSFLHKNHPGNQDGKFHLKIILKSQELKKMSRIESNKIIYKILNKELKENIHSIQIIIGDPIFFNKIKFILSELFFLSLSIKYKILFISLSVKNLLIL